MSSSSSATANAASSSEPRAADPPRIGVAGVGALGRHHARVAHSLPGARCSGVFDVDPARSAAIADRLDIPSRPSLRALLGASDAIVIAVPSTAHEEVALEAIAAGVHILVEKPLAPDLAGAERIVEAARARGVVVQVGHVERFNPVVRAALPLIDGPLFVESHRLAPFSPRSLDIAVVLDLMIHDVDLLCTLIPRPVESVAAVGVPVLSPHADIANARLEFRGGAVANLTASRISRRRVRKLRIWQRSGYLSLDLAAGVGEFHRLKRELPILEAWRERVPAGLRSAAPPSGLSALVDRTPVRGDGRESLEVELAAFRDAVAGVAPPPVTGEDGVRALRLSLAIEERIRDHVAHTRSSPS